MSNIYGFWCPICGAPTGQNAKWYGKAQGVEVKRNDGPFWACSESHAWEVKVMSVAKLKTRYAAMAPSNVCKLVRASI